MSIGNYDYESLCRAFINQSQPDGKTAGGRMSFEDCNLYSYSSLLAELDPVNNVLLIDANTEYYSQTSIRHTKALKSVLSDTQVYTVNLYDTPEENILLYVDHIQYLIQRYKRARVTKAGYKQKILAAYKEALAYADYAGVDKRTKPYKSLKAIFSQLFELKLL